MYEGQSYNYIFTPDANIFYFLFTLDLDQDQDIYIQVSNILDNNISIKAKQGSQVNHFNYDWSTKSNLLTIAKTTNPSQYQPKATYYIQLHYQQLLTQNLPFSIKYFHKQSIQQLSLNHLYQFSLYPNHTVRYQINLQFNDKD